MKSPREIAVAIAKDMTKRGYAPAGGVDPWIDAIAENIAIARWYGHRQGEFAERVAVKAQEVNALSAPRWGMRY